MRSICAVILIIFPLFALTQPKRSSVSSKKIIPRVNTQFHKLGDTYVRIRIFRYGENKDLFFINLHDDEITAVSSAKKILETHGGTLVSIDNNKQRNMRFKINGKTYAFDPNRIFSRIGIIQTLNIFGRSDPKAIDELDKFSKRITQFLPPAPTCVIALHNNSDGRYAITAYMVGREREKDAKAVRLMSAQDPDDLFLTTDSAIFRALTHEKYNAIWQDNINAHKDGSLSIYCGERNIRYLNCETEHGKFTQYSEMLNVAIKHLKVPEPEVIVYKYQLSPSTDSSRFTQPHEIYFGEKRVGIIQVKNDDKNKMTGKMTITHSFPLYDNMDFFYFRSGNNDRKIELRIDPTRSRMILDPEKATIKIKIIP